MATSARLAHAAISRPAAAPVVVSGISAVDWRAATGPGDRARWDSLALASAEPNPFCESWFLLPALRAFDPNGQVRLLCFELNGELAGLLPVVSQRNYYGNPMPHLAGWHHGNSFLGAPLIAAGAEAAFWRAVLDWADAHAGTALFLHLRQLPLDGPIHNALREALAERRRFAALVQQHERALLHSTLDREAYFEASLTAKKRKELRRQHARLGELGVLHTERQRDTSGLDTWITRFLSLEAAGWKGQAGSALGSTPETRRLFTDALHGAAQQGRLERLALMLDNRPIAMLATFLTPPGAFSFKTAYDETYARFSPGVLLQRENLALLHDPAVAWCDSCAAEGHPMIDHFWRERRTVGSLSIAIGGPLRRVAFRLLSGLETRNTAEPQT